MWYVVKYSENMATNRAASKRKLEKVEQNGKNNALTAQNGAEESDEEDYLQTISDVDSSDQEGDQSGSDESEGELENIDEDNTEDSSDADSEEGENESDDGEEEDDSDVEEEDENEEENDSEDKSDLEWESDASSEDDAENLLKNVKKVTKTKVKSQDSALSTESNESASEEHLDPSKSINSKDSKDSNVQGTSKDEYESGDTSDEEDIRNTVGNIPMNWYDEYPHLGYDWDGKPIMKPKTGDTLDFFLKRMEDPNFFRTVKDPQTGQDVVLSDRDVELIKRLQSGQIPDAAFDDTAPWVEYFTSDVMKTPLRKFPEHKRSFLPSKSEAAKVSKYVHALKMGWMKTRSELAEEQRKKREKNFYMLWGADDNSVEEMRRIENHLPAPKRHLPGHAESYNPPAEYLLDKEELRQWKKCQETPWKRKIHFVPQKYKSLREVPSYPRYIRERFLRCLDLYMCPRALKMKLMIEPEDLVPKLPSPRDLQPFPTTMSMVYEGHTDMVRCITVDPKGQFMISGSDDLTIKVWEVSTGRCLRTINVGGVVRSVCWCPNQALSIVAVAADRKLLLINPGVGDSLVIAKTDLLLKEEPEDSSVIPERVKAAVQWEQAKDEEWASGIRVVINHFKEIKQVTWHGRGDYFATVMPEGIHRSVVIHQLSKRRSQVPFSRSKGLVQCVLFHPVQPMLFVATQRNIRVYDLLKQEMVKKLSTLSRWVSSMAIHPGGDNLLVGTYDRKMMWFDLDLSTSPYQTLRLHGTAVRGVAYHKRYPLFASGSDDRSVIVSHGMVYNDLLKNPLIVPLKRLQYHEPNNDFGIFDVIFHPTQPWVFSAGSDKTIRLYS